jgi:hypothetical protein
MDHDEIAIGFNRDALALEQIVIYDRDHVQSSVMSRAPAAKLGVTPFDTARVAVKSP